MVLSRDIERTVRLLKVHIDKLRSWGFVASAAYSTKEGALLTYGSAVITDVINNHQQEIFTHPNYLNEQLGMELQVGADILDACGNVIHQNQLVQIEIPPQTTQQLLLPTIDPPLESRCFQDTRNLASNIVKASFGGVKRKIGWGIPENKPVWWPDDVPWTKRGVQSGVNLTQLRQIIRECYAHHGQTLPPPAPDIETKPRIQQAPYPVSPPYQTVTRTVRIQAPNPNVQHVQQRFTSQTPRVITPQRFVRIQQPVTINSQPRIQRPQQQQQFNAAGTSQPIQIIPQIANAVNIAPSVQQVPQPQNTSKSPKRRKTQPVTVPV